MELLRIIIKVLDEVNASDLKVYDMQNYSPLFDFMVLSSVSSDRQADAVLKHLKDELSKTKFTIKGIEGEGGGWILIDCTDVIINIFNGDTRGYYGLEKLFLGMKEIDVSEDNKIV